jgi:D-inositol-3-phosphate glycosyltransferase
VKIALIKGGVGDTYYELGLLSGLISKGVDVDFIGCDRDVLKHVNILGHKNVTFLNLRGSQNPSWSIIRKIFSTGVYYLRLVKYALRTDAKIFHIQWTEKFTYFDRTILYFFYKLLKKRIVFTAHNINAGERNGHDSLVNRLTLKIMYKTVDDIIVHTDRMKMQLVKGFNIEQEKVSVIEHGINCMIPITGLTSNEAKNRLGLKAEAKVILFFGNISPYKGIEYLLLALCDLVTRGVDSTLIIAGKIKDKDSAQYWSTLKMLILENKLSDHVICKTEYIPDADIEIYFKAADVLVLPYKQIFQSGVLYLSYSFGLPVIAADVGSFKEDIIAGKTGFVYRPTNAKDLAQKMDEYFSSELYMNLDSRRSDIRAYVNTRYSWEKIAARTKIIYDKYA